MGYWRRKMMAGCTYMNMYMHEKLLENCYLSYQTFQILNLSWDWTLQWHHMSAVASQITGISTVCSSICSGADQRKHQSSVSLAFMRGIHWWPVDYPHRRPVTQKMFPFQDSIMNLKWRRLIVAAQSIIWKENHWQLYRCIFWKNMFDMFRSELWGNSHATLIP